MKTLSVFTTYSCVQYPLSQALSMLKRFEKDTGVCLARMICKNILFITFIIIFFLILNMNVDNYLLMV